MKKKLDMNLLITTAICLMPIVLALIVYDELPERVAVHFNFSGNPDNYFPKALVAFGLPFFFAAVNVYMHFRLNNEPKSQNISSTVKILSKWAVPVVSITMIPITLFMAMGVKINITMIATAFAGVVIVIFGNYLPKCKRNYTVGIKLPWTLDSEENWNKTHRFSGFVWAIGGMIFIVNAFFTLWYIEATILFVLVTAPFVYSYVFFKMHPSQDDLLK